MKNSVIVAMVVSLFWLAYIKGANDQRNEDFFSLSEFVKENGLLEEELKKLKTQCSYRRVDERNKI